MKYILIAMLIGTTPTGGPVSKLYGVSTYTSPGQCEKSVAKHRKALRAVLDEQEWVTGNGKYKINYFEVFCRPYVEGSGV